MLIEEANTYVAGQRIGVYDELAIENDVAMHAVFSILMREIQALLRVELLLAVNLGIAQEYTVSATSVYRRPW